MGGRLGETRSMDKLPNDLLDRCSQFGRDICQASGNELSRARSIQGNGMGYSNPKWNIQGKIGECIFCLEAGLDPEKEVNFDTERGPDNFDVRVGILNVDVKTCSMNKKLLITSVGRSDHQFQYVDIFAAVRADLNGSGFVVGWISNDEFQVRRWIFPDGPARNLIPGTRYMCHDDLYTMESFPDGRSAFENVPWSLMREYGDFQ